MKKWKFRFVSQHEGKNGKVGKAKYSAEAEDCPAFAVYLTQAEVKATGKEAKDVNVTATFTVE